MARIETTIHIDGMTCASCEKRIEKSLAALPGVLSARASQARGRVVISSDVEVAPGLLNTAIEKSGYGVRDKPSAATPIALGIGFIVAAAYLVANSLGAFNNFPSIDSSLGYGMLVVIGLLTSVHCVAMCGGLVISQSLKPSGMSASGLGTPSGSSLSRLVPALLYNGGRVLSYTLVGAIVGGIGSALSFSPEAMGLITAAAGLFMLWLGLKMIGIMPEFPRILPRLPRPLRAVGERLTGALAGRGPFAVGILGGLMPCGPLQTMQLYALGTGSALAGAFSMFLFSLGTVPLMLAFGATAALLPRKFMPIMIRASAVLVLLLGTLTIGRAAALAGIALPDPLVALSSRSSEVSTASKPANREELAAALAIPIGAKTPGAGENGVLIQRSGPGDEADFTDSEARGELVAGNSQAPAQAVIKDGVQTVVTVFGPNNYAPFVVQAGVPLKWIVRIKKEDITGCNRTLIVPAYRIRKDLKPGDNLIEFTPTAAGIVPYSCWMGMIRSAFKIVPDLGASNSSLDLPGATSGSGTAVVSAGSSASPGGCCGGSSNQAFAEGRVPVTTIGMPVITRGIEEITITVDDQGYNPAAIVLQRGMKAIIHFKAKALSSCNSTVYFPEYNGSLDLSRGELETPEIPVTSDFGFQCGMGMIHGYVKTVDNLAQVNIEAIKKELAAYRAPASSGGSCCGN